MSISFVRCRILYGLSVFPSFFRNVFKCLFFKVINKVLTLYHTILTFNDPEKKPYKNTVRKGENAGNQCFLLFPQCFYFPKRNFNFPVTFILSSASSFNLDQSKKLSFGKGLNTALCDTGNYAPTRQSNLLWP